MGPALGRSTTGKAAWGFNYPAGGLHVGNDIERIILTIGGKDNMARDSFQASLDRSAAGSSCWYSRVLSKLAVRGYEAHLTSSHGGYADMPCKMSRQPETLCIKGHAQYGRWKIHRRLDVESSLFVAVRLDGHSPPWRGSYLSIRYHYFG